MEGEKIDSFDDALGAIAIFATKNYIVLRKHKTDYFYSVYLKKDNSFKMELCRKGQGPSEFLAPVYCEQSNGDDFWVLDRITSVLSKIDISKSIKEGKTVISNKVDFSNLIKYQIREIFIIDSTRYLFSEDNLNCPYFIFDMKDKKEVEVKNDFELEIKKYSYALLQKMTVYNKTKQKFVSAYYSFPKVSFSSLSEGTFSSILYSTKDLALNDNYEKKDLDYSYFDAISCTDDYVYCLYNNSCRPDDNSSILVFDWDGSPVCQYYLSGKYNYFTIDTCSKKIYAMDYEKESDIVTMFDLP